MSRLYFFNNMYMKGIQAGIQAGHAAVDLVDDYRDNKDVRDWARNHKTFIILNGGDHTNLINIMTYLDTQCPKVPSSVFTEPGLDNAITSIAVLVPEKVYEHAAVLRENDVAHDASIPEEDMALINLLNKYGLMR